MRAHGLPPKGRDKNSETRRYCPGCGRVVPFHDSGKIRRNANGKTIHAFAIFKCPKDHTWNRRLG